MTADKRVSVVETVCDVEDAEKPFGKRYGQEEINLLPEHMKALQEGKLIALDVQGEYVVFLGLKKSAR